MKAIFFFVTLTSFLYACSSQPDYTQATSIPALKTPEGVTNERLGQLYVVPEQSGATADTDAVPFPPTVGAQESAQIAFRQNLGLQSWVFNAKSAATTWSQLSSFLQQNTVPVIKRDLATATIETGWFSLGLQPGYQVKYQFRLEQGLQPNTTEVFLVNVKREQSAGDANPIEWTQTATDRVHANWLSDRLIASLNDADNIVGDSYLATTINLPRKVTFTSRDNEPVLSTIVTDERLDSALKKALTNTPYLLYDNTAGIYHFNRGNTEKPSFLIRLFTWSDGGPQANSDYTLSELLQHMPVQSDDNIFPDLGEQMDKPLSGVEGYLLVVRRESDRNWVYVRDGYGKRLPVDKARELLDGIRLRLI